MLLKNVKLNSVAQAMDFVKTVSKIDGDVDIIAGHKTIDAKSIIGVLSLDLSRVLSMKIITVDEDKAKKICDEKLDRYIVECKPLSK